MEDPSPFSQHLDTNYVPSSQELDTLKVLIEERLVVIDAIDAEIAELVRKRKTHIRYVRKHRALATPVRRLPDDILLTILFNSLALAEPWPSPHPAVVASQVCHRWRRLALGTPLLWTKIEIVLPWESMEEEYRHSRFQETYRRDNMEAYLLRCIANFRPYVEVVERRVRAFIQRSSGCPLELSLTAENIAEAPPSARLIDEWSSLLGPLCKLMTEPTTRWKNVNLDIIVSPDCPISLRFLRIPVVSSGLGMQSATLSVRSPSRNPPIPDALWNAFLPAGRIDLRSAELRAFSVRMMYAEMSRIQISWDGLTTLVFGSPPNSNPFLPSEAHAILRLTPNLIDCTIHLVFPPSHQTPSLNHLALPHLESLTIEGNVPPRAFAEALHLPSLTRLYAVRAVGPHESGATSSIFLRIQRHGTQFKGISVAHAFLTRPTLSVALKSLPSIESLELAWNPSSDSGRHGNTHNRGFNELELLGESNPGSVSDCMCPRLRRLDCKFFNGSSEETGKAIVDFIEKRRSVTRPSSVARLEKINVTFSIPPAWSVREELKRRGVDTGGVWVPTQALTDDELEDCY